MSFDTLTPRLKQVSQGALSFCKKRYGKNGLRIGEAIDDDIGWKPTFHFKPRSSLIIGIEVNEVLYPTALKVAAHDIKLFDYPISVYLGCPLEVYQADPQQRTIQQLRKHGFGIITVDDQGKAVIQCGCIPLAQHIPESEFDEEVRSLPQRIRVAFNTALTTYQTNEGQGVQEGSQIVEALVGTLAEQTVRRGTATRSALTGTAADTIDGLYVLPSFKNHRAALAGARDFLREHRNVASHPSGTAKEAIAKIRRCRSGFFEAVRTTKRLVEAIKALGLRPTIHVT